MDITHYLSRDPETERLDSRNPLGRFEPTPGKILNVQLVEATSSSITLSFDPDNLADSYNIYFNGVLKTNTTSTSPRVSGLSPETSYDVRVAGENEKGEGPKSDPVTMTTEVAPEVEEGDLSVLKAFPTAEGGGALSEGGRGGTIMYVTTLEDSRDPVPPGSLRAAVEASGPRIVVFRVSGTINLVHHLWIRNPYLTIAGQTAPGGGVQLRATSGMSQQNIIIISTHNVVIQYLRLRKGKQTGGTTLGVTTTDGQSPENIIVDHCSSYWTENTNWNVYTSNDNLNLRSVTLQNSILAEPLDRPQAHIGGHSSESSFRMSDIDLHNNYMAHGSHRMPMYRPQRGRLVNNIIYNVSSWWTRVGPNSHVDVIGNLYKQGAPHTSSRPKSEIEFWEYNESQDHSDKTRIRPEDQVHSYYVAGNRGLWSGMEPSADQWNDTRWVPQPDDGGPNGPAMDEPPPEEWRRDPWTPLPTTIPITVRNVDTLTDHLFPHVGASHRLAVNQSEVTQHGYWVFNRDSADERVISDYENGTGVVAPTHEDNVGGFPTIDSGSPYTSTAGDGIADYWKEANGISVSSSVASQEVPGLNGWTYMDLFLAGLNLPGSE